MKIQYNNTQLWKEAIQRLIDHNVDFASGSIEDPFIVVYDEEHLEEVMSNSNR